MSYDYRNAADDVFASAPRAIGGALIAESNTEISTAQSRKSPNGTDNQGRSFSYYEGL